MPEFQKIKITDIHDECKNTKTFVFGELGKTLGIVGDFLESDDFWQINAGKYSIFWLPGVSANPFSYSYTTPPAITVRKISDDDTEEIDPETKQPIKSFAWHLFQKEPGDYIFASAPRGRSFEDVILPLVEPHPIGACLIAGGCSAAPIACLMDGGLEMYEDQTILLGAKTKDELLFEKRIREYVDERNESRPTKLTRLMVSTDDGSKGHKGYVTDMIERAHLGKERTAFFICGPEAMMKVAAEKALHYARPEHIIVLLERYMKCGDGICGSCACGGRLVCKDGPAFPYDELMGTEFGQRRRARSGAYEKV